MNTINTLQQSIDKHFEKYPRYVDNHIMGLIKFGMIQHNDAQDKYKHEREADFLRGYEAAVKTIIEFISSADKTLPYEISKEYVGRMIVEMLRKMHTDEYFVNSELYNEFDKYANIDYKPKHKPCDMFCHTFVTPYNGTEYYIVIGIDNETNEYDYLIVHDHLGGTIERERMSFKKFDDMIESNYIIDCTCGEL